MKAKSVKCLEFLEFIFTWNTRKVVHRQISITAETSVGTDQINTERRFLFTAAIQKTFIQICPQLLNLINELFYYY